MSDDRFGVTMRTSQPKYRSKDWREAHPHAAQRLDAQRTAQTAQAQRLARQRAQQGGQQGGQRQGGQQGGKRGQQYRSQQYQQAQSYQPQYPQQQSQTGGPAFAWRQGYDAAMGAVAGYPLPQGQPPSLYYDAWLAGYNAGMTAATGGMQQPMQPPPMPQYQPPMMPPMGPQENYGAILESIFEDDDEILDMYGALFGMDSEDTDEIDEAFGEFASLFEGEEVDDIFGKVIGGSKGGALALGLLTGGVTTSIDAVKNWRHVSPDWAKTIGGKKKFIDELTGDCYDRLERGKDKAAKRGVTRIVKLAALVQKKEPDYRLSDDARFLVCWLKSGQDWDEFEKGGGCHRGLQARAFGPGMGSGQMGGGAFPMWPPRWQGRPPMFRHGGPGGGRPDFPKRLDRPFHPGRPDRDRPGRPDFDRRGRRGDVERPDRPDFDRRGRRGDVERPDRPDLDRRGRRGDVERPDRPEIDRLGRRGDVERPEPGGRIQAVPIPPAPNRKGMIQGRPGGGGAQGITPVSPRKFPSGLQKPSDISRRAGGGAIAANPDGPTTAYGAIQRPIAALDDESFGDLGDLFPQYAFDEESFGAFGDITREDLLDEDYEEFGAFGDITRDDLLDDDVEAFGTMGDIVRNDFFDDEGEEFGAVGDLTREDLLEGLE